MQKVAVVIIFLIVVCLGFNFFDTLGFFDYQPQGEDIGYDSDKYGFDNIIVDGFLITGLGFLAALVGRIVKINAFGLVMFTEIFWFPYIKTQFIFTSILWNVPAVLLGIVTIWTTVMLFLFAYTLIEWSNSAVITS